MIPKWSWSGHVARRGDARQIKAVDDDDDDEFISMQKINTYEPNCKLYPPGCENIGLNK